MLIRTRKKWLISGLLLPFYLHASASTDSSEMTKENWLSQLKTFAPSMICKGFIEDAAIKSKLDKQKIDNAKCLELIPLSFDKCQKEFYPKLPPKINSQNANTWGHQLGECIGTDFAQKYLVPTLNNDES